MKSTFYRDMRNNEKSILFTIIEYSDSDILFQIQTAPLFFLEIPCKNQLIRIHGLTHKQVILVLENQVRIIFYVHQNSLNSIIHIPWLKIVTSHFIFS